MIAEFNIENFFSIKSAQKISFEPSSDIFMSDEYSYEVKDGVRSEERRVGKECRSGGSR